MYEKINEITLDKNIVPKPISLELGHIVNQGTMFLDLLILLLKRPIAMQSKVHSCYQFSNCKLNLTGMATVGKQYYQRHIKPMQT